jgi:hypothetical protein
MFLEDDFKPIAEARVRIKFGVAFFVLILLLVIIRLGFVSLSGKKQALIFFLHRLKLLGLIYSTATAKCWQLL